MLTRLFTPRSSFESIEVFIEAGAEFLGKRRAGIARRLRDASVFADFFVVGAATDQRQGRILSIPTAAATGAGPAATASFRIDAFRLQQQFDRLGFGGDP